MPDTQQLMTPRLRATRLRPEGHLRSSQFRDQGFARVAVPSALRLRMDSARHQRRSVSAGRKPRTGRMLDRYCAREMLTLHVNRYESVRIARDVDPKRELAMNHDVSVAM